MHLFVLPDQFYTFHVFSKYFCTKLFRDKNLREIHKQKSQEGIEEKQQEITKCLKKGTVKSQSRSQKGRKERKIRVIHYCGLWKTNTSRSRTQITEDLIIRKGKKSTFNKDLIDDFQDTLINALELSIVRKFSLCPRDTYSRRQAPFL